MTKYICSKAILCYNDNLIYIYCVLGLGELYHCYTLVNYGTEEEFYIRLALMQNLFRNYMLSLFALSCKKRSKEVINN